jgi:hypothetical protein
MYGQELTEEDIDRMYAAAMDSVDMIRAGAPAGMSAQDWAYMVSRNREHLQIMVRKDCWGARDMTAIVEESGL